MNAALTSVPWMPDLDVVDERVGEVVLVAVLEVMREERVVLAVDAGAHHELDAGLRGHSREKRASRARSMHAGSTIVRTPCAIAPRTCSTARRLLVLVVEVRVLVADGLARRQQVLVAERAAHLARRRSARRSSRSVAPSAPPCLRRTGPTLTMRSADASADARRAPIGRFASAGIAGRCRHVPAGRRARQPSAGGEATMESRGWARFAPLTGVVFFVLIVVAIVIARRDAGQQGLARRRS